MITDSTELTFNNLRNKSVENCCKIEGNDQIRCFYEHRMSNALGNAILNYNMDFKSNTKRNVMPFWRTIWVWSIDGRDTTKRCKMNHAEIEKGKKHNLKLYLLIAFSSEQNNVLKLFVKCSHQEHFSTIIDWKKSNL